MHAIDVIEISKSYRNDAPPAVDNVSFHVKSGELFGLIGPDGAGKTSLFRILTTLILPNTGSASIIGYDVVKDYKKIRNLIGYMPGRFSLYQDLTVEENLNFFATVFNTTIKENYHLIRDIYIQLEPFKHRRAGKLSGGMKQKLALCCALIHKPAVLFLDEPTTGVDPVSRKEFWEILKVLKLQGISILVSTPYMDEALLCERIALIQSGRILAVDTPLNLVKHYPLKLFRVKAERRAELIHDIRSFSSELYVYPFGAYLHIAVDKSYSREHSDLKHLRDYLSAKNNSLQEILPIEPTIEDYFIYLLRS